MNLLAYYKGVWEERGLGSAWVRSAGRGGWLSWVARRRRGGERRTSGPEELPGAETTPMRSGGAGRTKEAITMASDNVRQFTDGNFESEVLQSKQPVLVDFWAEWCMPCRMLTPTIEALATDFTGKAKIGKLDTDANKMIAVKYNITAIPTIIIFKDGQPVKMMRGLKKKEELAAALAEVGAK